MKFVLKMPPDWAGFDKDTKVLTNGDLIRSMTDEELAKFFCGRLDCYSGYCPGKHLCRPGNNGLVEWMKQPAEVDNG